MARQVRGRNAGAARLPQQRFGIVRGIGKQRDPNRRRRVDFRFPEPERRVQRTPQFFGCKQGQLRALHHGKNAGQLVAPEFPDEIVGSQHLGAQAGYDPRADRVADLIAPQGIDAADDPAIHEQQSQALSVRLPLFDAAAQAIGKRHFCSGRRRGGSRIRPGRIATTQRNNSFGSTLIASYSSVRRIR